MALLVGSTSGRSTNVNSSSASTSRTNSLTRLVKSRSAGLMSAVASRQYGWPSPHRRPSSTAPPPLPACLPQPPIPSRPLGVVVQRQEPVQEPLVLRPPRVQQRQADGLAQQVRPALLRPGEPPPVHGGIVAHPHAVEDVGRQDRVQGGIVLVAAEQEDALPLRRERPQRAAFAPDPP